MVGDSVLAVFETAAGAVSAALAVQAGLASLASCVDEGRCMCFRIGVHLGDVIERDDGTIYGDGVNIAARSGGGRAVFRSGYRCRADAAHGVDVSHRGGNPGFIRVEEGVLKIPDYVGNNYFNTLGNLAVNPRVGLLVIDFERGDLLFLAATVDVLWAGREVEEIAGAKRVLVMRVAGTARSSAALGLSWMAAERSPFLQEL